MKSAFIVLSLAAVACAQYNYQAGGSNGGGFNGDTGFNGGSAGGLDGGRSGGSLNFGSSSHAVASQGGLFTASNAAPSVAPQGSVNNQFYTYTVDENDFNDDDAQRAAQSVSQASRIVFIKGPSNKGLEDALLSLGQQTAPKTAIYVLSKEADIADLANKLDSVNKDTNNQPEVNFVKYRTPEDAANAQRAIQGQYDALGGSSRNIDGGIVTLLNFVSTAPVASGPVADAPDNLYLPASVLRQFRH